MSSKFIILGKSCKLNKESINSKKIPKSIYYLDTGNITRNFIKELHFFSKESGNYPSRAKRKVSDQTIIYSTVRPNQAHFGIIKNPQENLIVSTGFVTIDVEDSELDPLFLYYLITRKEITIYLQSIAENSTSSYPSIKPEDLGKLKLRVPSNKLVQQKIASVLSALDAKIELNNQINAELEKMAKTLYDYWFVQFDFPNENGKPYKSSSGPMVWNQELKREIPEGWEVKKLGKAIKIVRGASPRPIDDFLSNEGMPWVKISDATKSDNRFVVETKQFIIQDGVSCSRSVFPNTLILSNSASPCIPRIMKIRACVHDGWLIIEEYTEGLTPEFMFHYFEYERPRIICLGSGSIFKNLKTDYLKDLKFILPHKSVLDQITPMFKTISESIFNKTLENQTLAELRDWLLPMLMNGQVKVE